MTITDTLFKTYNEELAWLAGSLRVAIPTDAERDLLEHYDDGPLFYHEGGAALAAENAVHKVRTSDEIMFEDEIPLFFETCDAEDEATLKPIYTERQKELTEAQLALLETLPTDARRLNDHYTKKELVQFLRDLDDLFSAENRKKEIAERLARVVTDKREWYGLN